MVTYSVLTKEQLPLLLKLYEQLNPQEKTITITDANKIFEKTEQNNIKYFVAIDDGKIISSCYIAVILNLTHDGKSIGFIENVVTDEKYRRKGIGRKVIEMAIKYARENNCYKVVLKSNSIRKEAHIFYENIGFDGNGSKAFELKL
jgi:GNAT superfamily N-acetyltransferase